MQFRKHCKEILIISVFLVPQTGTFFLHLHTDYFLENLRVSVKNRVKDFTRMLVILIDVF